MRRVSPCTAMSATTSRTSSATSAPSSSTGIRRTVIDCGPERATSKPSSENRSDFSSTTDASRSLTASVSGTSSICERMPSPSLRVFQFFVGDALMRRVHVDEHEAVRVLGEHEHAVQLRERVAERRTVARLRQRCVYVRMRVAVIVRCRNVRRPLAEQRRVGGERLAHAEAERLLAHRFVRAKRRLRTCVFVRGCGCRLRARACTRTRERIVQRAINEIVYEPPFAKTHFAFRGMHVDVDEHGIELEKQHERGMPAVEQHIRIRLTHRMRDEPIAYRPAVDMEMLLIGLRARRGRQTDPAGQAQSGGGIVDREDSARRSPRRTHRRRGAHDRILRARA